MRPAGTPAALISGTPSNVLAAAGLLHALGGENLLPKTAQDSAMDLQRTK